MSPHSGHASVPRGGAAVCLPAPPVAHAHEGPPSRTAYKRGCRHPDCREANNAYLRDYRELRSSGPREPAKVGTRSCYVRCSRRPEGPHVECREANRRYQRAHRRRVPEESKVRRSWEAWEDALLGTDIDRRVAERLGRTREAVKVRRQALRIARAVA